MTGDVTDEYLHEIELRRNDAAKQRRDDEDKGLRTADAGESTDAAVGM